jgi:hypothetical protein
VVSIKPWDVIEFTYKNWRGETSKRRAVVRGLHFGDNSYHKERQMFLHCFDLDKGEYRSFAIKDILEDLVVVEHGKPLAYVISQDEFDGVWYHRTFVKVFFDKKKAEEFIWNDKRSLEMDEVELQY